MIAIRAAKESEFDRIWNVFREVVKTGDTYAFPPDIDKEAAKVAWMSPGVNTYVATSSETIVGTYIIKDVQPGLGSHVANASFMVAPDAQGKGIGRLMGEHALVEARRLGYQAMQFNQVIASNTAAVGLWEKLGFTIVGTIPKGFRHQELGLVDAHIMHRFL